MISSIPILIAVLEERVENMQERVREIDDKNSFACGLYEGASEGLRAALELVREYQESQERR